MTCKCRIGKCYRKSNNISQNTIETITYEKPPEEIITDITGTCGLWQIYVISILFIVMFFHGLNMFTSVFMAPPYLYYRCVGDNRTDGKYCRYENGTECPDFEFINSHGRSTPIQKWSLICNRKHLALSIDITFRLGLSIGYVISGYLADKFGRKKVLFISIALQPMAGILEITSTMYTFFLISRSLFALSLSGTGLMAGVIAAEITSNKWRTFVLGIVYLPVPLASICLALISNVIKDITRVGLLVSLPQIILFFFFSIIYETPSWLLMKNKLGKTETVMVNIARLNKIEMPSAYHIIPIHITTSQHSFKILYKALKFRNSCYLIISLLLVWFIVGFCISFSIITLWESHKDLTMVTVYMGAAFSAGLLITIALCHVLQHGAVLSIFIFMMNAFIVSAFVLTEKHKIAENVLYYLQILAIFSGGGCVSVLWNVTSRTFPTLLRALGTGLCHGIGQIGFLIISLMFQRLRKNLIVFYSVFTTLTVIAFACSALLFSVHKRELPDNLEDMVNFRRLYKPIRWSGIRSNSPTLDEIVVNVVDLDKARNSQQRDFDNEKSTNGGRSNRTKIKLKTSKK